MEEFFRLEKEGADFNIQDEFGFTPLMMAAKSGNHTLVKLLLKYVRNIDIEDKEGNTALYYAVESEHLEIVQTLYENGAHISDFIYMYAITTNKKRIVRYFDRQDKNKQVFLK